MISFYDSQVLENNTPPITALNVNVSNLTKKAGSLLVDIIKFQATQKSATSLE